MPDKQHQRGRRPFKEEIAEVFLKTGVLVGVSLVGLAIASLLSLPDTVQILSPGCLNSLCIGTLALTTVGGGLYLKRRIASNLANDQTPSDIAENEAFPSDNKK
ncbi:hypothetical protein H3C65_03180 [Patescibacteria group bacterium]|nr:hypothetical protein [Patescibacteria group bacterium]